MTCPTAYISDEDPDETHTFPLMSSHVSRTDDTSTSTSSDPVSRVEDIDSETRTGDSTNTGSSSQPPAFGNFDFSKAKEPPQWPSKDRAPEYKSYRVKKKFGTNTQYQFTIVLHKKKLDNVFPSIASKLGINIKNIKRMVVSYPLKHTDGSAETMHIAGWDSDLKTTLDAFYCQTDNESLLEVEVTDKMESERGQRPSEEKKSKMSEHNTTDRSIYAMLVKDPEIAEKYEQTQRYLATILGDADAVNLLNPVRFVCHVMDCRRILHLKSFSNISSITEHWKNHEKSDKSCEVLRRRHNYMKSLKKKNYWKTEMTPEELETLNDGSGQPLAVQQLMRGKFLAKSDKEFRGKHLLIKESILKRVIDGDPTVLDAVPTPTVHTFFST